ncbi:MAG: hypothetical protein ACYTFY_22865 [Planctomycetota bacterium]
MPVNPLASANNHVVKDETPLEIASRQRGAAQNFLGQGADGIYMFNYPCKLVEYRSFKHRSGKDYKIKTEPLSEIGRPATLKGKKKQYTFWEALPIQLETERPPEYYQTIDFALHDPDLKNPKTKVTLKFIQYADRSPHAPGKSPDPSPYLKKGQMQYLLNDKEIKAAKLKFKRKQAEKISSGFILPKHQSVEITLSGREFVKGINKLAFFIPGPLKDKDPYIYIYQLTVEIN